MSLMRSVGLLLLTTLVVTGLSAPKMASAVPRGDPCGIVGIDYEPTEVVPGQEMTLNLSIRNCSTERQLMLLRALASGPCPFNHPEDGVYEVNGGSAVGYFYHLSAPSCPGNYRARVQLSMPDIILDRDQSRFTVTGNLT
jgi:hypothetical protein